jgi:hypothetical protein
MKIECIKCYGKSIEICYFPKDLTIERWENFLENHDRGNETFIKFQEKDGRIITINPDQWGSVEVISMTKKEVKECEESETEE